MSLTGIILGVINVAIVAAVLLLVGAIILWFCQWFGLGVPAQVQKLYIGIVALVALYMLVALLFGIPSIRIIGAPGGGLRSHEQHHQLQAAANDSSTHSRFRLSGSRM